MLLILEIILTIIAWRRGWKWRAFLPSVIILGTAFVVGLFAGATAGAEELPAIAEVLVDVVNICILTILIIKPRRIAEPPQSWNQPDVTTVREKDDSVCPDCGISFSGNSTLSSHRERMHTLSVPIAKAPDPGSYGPWDPYSGRLP